MQSVSQTPADLVINPRNVMLGRGKRQPRWWKNNDPVATAFYNSLSMAFPLGEAFFIDSVRHYRDSVPPSLQAQIDAFIKQEGGHSREHAHFNRQVRDSGYDTSTIDADMAKWSDEVKEAPADVNLTVTAATEHLTAIIAHALLKSDRHFKDDSAETAGLWKWHAIEEVEHKSVAYDTFLAVTGGLSRFERWKFRSVVLLIVTGEFMSERIRFMSRFFDQDGINKPWTWMRVFFYLFLYPGLLRQIFPAWLSYFRPNFHPWHCDDRALIAAAEATLALRPSGQTGAASA